jgi:hypothetical protein
MNLNNYWPKVRHGIRDHDKWIITVLLAIYFISIYYFSGWRASPSFNAIFGGAFLAGLINYLVNVLWEKHRRDNTKRTLLLTLYVQLSLIYDIQDHKLDVGSTYSTINIETSNRIIESGVLDVIDDEPILDLLINISNIISRWNYLVGLFNSVSLQVNPSISFLEKQLILMKETNKLALQHKGHLDTLI